MSREILAPQAATACKGYGWLDRIMDGMVLVLMDGGFEGADDGADEYAGAGI